MCEQSKNSVCIGRIRHYDTLTELIFFMYIYETKLIIIECKPDIDLIVIFYYIMTVYKRKEKCFFRRLIIFDDPFLKKYYFCTTPTISLNCKVKNE